MYDAFGVGGRETGCRVIEQLERFSETKRTALDERPYRASLNEGGHEIEDRSVRPGVEHGEDIRMANARSDGHLASKPRDGGRSHKLSRDRFDDDRSRKHRVVCQVDVAHYR